jgi:hypothetical protein
MQRQFRFKKTLRKFNKTLCKICELLQDAKSIFKNVFSFDLRNKKKIQSFLYNVKIPKDILLFPTIKFNFLISEKMDWKCDKVAAGTDVAKMTRTYPIPT